MAYRIAGIDVHKKMLAVVVADVEGESEYQFERRQFGTTPDHLRLVAQPVSLLARHYYYRKSARRKRSLQLGHPFDNSQITGWPEVRVERPTFADRGSQHQITSRLPTTQEVAHHSPISFGYAVRYALSRCCPHLKIKLTYNGQFFRATAEVAARRLVLWPNNRCLIVDL
jgi:hypothetical protein